MSFPRRRASQIAFKALYHLIYFYYFFILGIKIVGKIKHTGKPIIFVSNHRSFNDPPALGAFIYSKRRNNDVYALAKSELFDVSPFFAKILATLHSIPLQRDGLDMSSIAHTLELLSKGDHILIFPEGTRNKTENLLEGKPGAGFLALRSNATVVPIFLKNTDKPILRQFFRIDRIEIRVGDAIEFPSMRANSRNSKIATQIMMKEIGALND